MESKAPRPGPFRFGRQMAMATELPFALVAPVLVGGFAGAWLDRQFGIAPLLMLGLGALGFYAGVREMWRRMKLLEKLSNDQRKP